LPDGFYAEVAYNTAENEVEFVFGFEAGSEDDRLPDYAVFVKLLDRVPDTE
jgi:hypothetical protein